jgi:hypothetical protein
LLASCKSRGSDDENKNKYNFRSDKKSICYTHITVNIGYT